MKAIIFSLFLFVSFSAFAQYDINATCGEVYKAGNGRILKRLEPNFFGLNPKYVLKTKFENYVELSASYFIYKTQSLELTHGRKKELTGFSDKSKFQTAKADLKEALKSSHSVWACVGKIDIALKYKGRHAYVSTVSLEDAVAKFQKQVDRHR